MLGFCVVFEFVFDLQMFFAKPTLIWGEGGTICGNKTLFRVSLMSFVRDCLRPSIRADHLVHEIR